MRAVPDHLPKQESRKNSGENPREKTGSSRRICAVVAGLASFLEEYVRFEVSTQWRLISRHPN